MSYRAGFMDMLPWNESFVFVRRFSDRLRRKPHVRLDVDFNRTSRTGGKLINRTIRHRTYPASWFPGEVPIFPRRSAPILGLLGVVIYQSSKLFFALVVVFPCAMLRSRAAQSRMKNFARVSRRNIRYLLGAPFQTPPTSRIVRQVTPSFEVEKFNAENKIFGLNLKAVNGVPVNPIMEMLGAVGIAWWSSSRRAGGHHGPDEGYRQLFEASLRRFLWSMHGSKKGFLIASTCEDAIAASERTFD